MKKRWRIAETCPPEFQAEAGVESPILAQLLWNRGIRSREDAQTFLAPSWETGIHDPERFRHMSAAVARAFDALEHGERITVHGDYDADGVTGSTILITTLREIESHLKAVSCTLSAESLIDFYIPHRDKEGYGLHRETVPKLSERGTRLVITVDCGIACVDEIALAKTQSMETIVVDHHRFGETLPDAHLIHPGLPGETYPFGKLAAVGVAFKFACALLSEARRRGLSIPDGWEKWLLDLVAIATVTDMVPLTGENRVLETYGLKVLNKTRRPGLRALFEIARLEPGKIDTESVGFMIGPRLNAAGRMDHATLALRLLLAENDPEARTFALELERCNRERQEATKRMMAEADEILGTRNAERGTQKQDKILFLWDERWSPSLVGLAAGKYLERYACPVVVVGRHEGRWIGSGRSFSGYDITAAMREAGAGILTRVGGHVQACGFSLLDAKRLPEMRDRLFAHAEERLKEEDLVPTIDVDAEIPLEAADWPLMNDIIPLAPFGEGNRQPVFASRGCAVVAAQAVGSTMAHLRLKLLTSSGRRISAIGFKLGALAAGISVGTNVDIVYHVDENEWNGRREVQCKLLDVCTA